MKKHNCKDSKCFHCQHNKEENDLVKWSRVIQKISDEANKRNKPLSVRRLIKYLKKLPPKAIVELTIVQQSQYRTDPISISGKMKAFGIGKYGSAKRVVTLIAEREN